jgi:predicted amidohydrolase YtcJ
MRTGTLLCFLFVMAGSLASSAQAQTLPPEVVAYADIVFFNGKVYTADEAFSVAQAVAIRDGKFLAVGDSQRILAMAGPQTRKVDLQGRSVTPGMIATHQHGYVGNTSKAGKRVRFQTVASGLEEIKAEVAKYPPGKHVYFSGPSIKQIMVELTLAQLDSVSPNNPVAITLQNNQVVINSQMLKLIPHDVSGVLKDAQGRPTGQLRGGAGGIVAYEIMPWHEDFKKSVEEERKNMERWPPVGITTLMGRSQGQAITILRELWRAGELKTRVRFAHEFLRQNPRPEMFLKRMGNLTDLGDDWFKIIGATTQAADGDHLTVNPRLKVPENSPYGPYGNDKWGETGDYATSERLNIILANRYGWSLKGYHSNGDKANDMLLDAFAEAHKERSLVGRHFGFDHQEMLRPRQFALIKEMDITPTFLDGTFSGDNSNLVEEFGADEVVKMSPVKSTIAAGIKPAIEVGEGMEAIKNFLLRTTEDGRVWNPQERVSRQEALWMYTSWAARYSGEQNILGSIEKGKLGDLVVLGGDYMTWPEEELENLGVLMTVVGGKVVFEAPGAF